MKSAWFKSAIALALFLGAAGGSWWMVAAQGIPGGAGIPSSGGPGQGPPGGGIAPVGGMPGAGAGMGPGGGMQAASSKWKYEFYIINHPLSQTDVVNLLNKRESEGWEFVSVMQVKADAIGLGGAAGGAPGGGKGGGGGDAGGAGEGGQLNTAYVFRRPNNILNAGGGMMGGPGGMGPVGMGSGMPSEGGMGGPGPGGTPAGGPGTGRPGGMGMRGGPPGASPFGGEGGASGDMSGAPPGIGMGSPGGRGAPPPVVSEAEVHQQLRGTWNILQNNSTNSSQIAFLVFGKDNQLTIDGKTMTYYINQTKSPAQLNIVGNGVLMQCIYQIEDGRLTIAYFGRPEVDRPAGFAPQSNHTKSPLIIPTFVKITNPAPAGGK